ncbi:MAG: hypothetical protein AAGC79_11335 [Pseudomonadota bacterium]
MTSIDGGITPKMTTLNEMNFDIDSTRDSSNSISFSQSSIDSESYLYDSNRLRFYSDSMSNDLETDYKDQMEDTSSKSLGDKMKSWGRATLSGLKEFGKQLITLGFINLYRAVKSSNEEKDRLTQDFNEMKHNNLNEPQPFGAPQMERVGANKDDGSSSLAKLYNEAMKPKPLNPDDVEFATGLEANAVFEADIMDGVIDSLVKDLKSEGAENKRSTMKTLTTL